MNTPTYGTRLGVIGASIAAIGIVLIILTPGYVDSAVSRAKFQESLCKPSDNICGDKAWESVPNEGILITAGGIAAGIGLFMFAIGSIMWYQHPKSVKSSLATSSTPVTQSSYASPSAVSQAQSVDIQRELQKAADMLKSGLIDDDEYKELKKKIISKS